jgi:hypothetical protein
MRPNDRTWVFTEEQAEPWGGFEYMAKKMLALLPESISKTDNSFILGPHGDIDEVFMDDGKLVIVFTDAQSERYFANEVLQ